MAVISRLLAFSLIPITSVLGASIPWTSDAGPRAAIAVKLSPSTLQARSTTSGAEIVQGLVRGAQKTTLAKRDVDFKVEPLITTLSSAQIDELIARAKKHTPSYEPADFGSWYRVIFDSNAPLPGKQDAEVGDLLKALGVKDEVASVQPLGGSTKLPAVNPVDDPLYVFQSYLKAAPFGIEARYAWNFPGGDGSNTRVIDIERGWKLDHEDLAAKNITLLAGMNVRDRFDFNYPHGTAVLGEMLMVDNGVGGVGVAPGAAGGVVGIQRTVGGGPVENPPEAILEAVSFSSFGDVILLEMQAGDEFGNLWPIEINDAEFAAIQLAVAAGVTVIEPAANGGMNMDLPVTRVGDPVPKSLLAVGHAQFRDSGAVIVGAGSSVVPRTRLSFSNYGSRVDVHAWGHNIRTTSVDVPAYTDAYADFDGTSGAAPIIAGAALVMQGIVKVRTGGKLTPAALRTRIKIGGTDSATPWTDKIGVMPNLKNLIDWWQLNYL
ncbi:peptidase S8/S53 domain-containing protein [Schizothecium vesticola]|uniref:Peptidase S8/S53 domain-containing protein n=1 Tax=Schizothecium vesticola TaxID=314040 RepID=A0AA40F0P4_9PEZI|nr:peptidase S8/S53 domain-containing protein [Schizothecium vesticola]